MTKNKDVFVRDNAYWPFNDGGTAEAISTFLAAEVAKIPEPHRASHTFYFSTYGDGRDAMNEHVRFSLRYERPETEQETATRERYEREQSEMRVRAAQATLERHHQRYGGR